MIMLWNKTDTYTELPYGKEAEFQDAAYEVLAKEIYDKIVLDLDENAGKG